MNSPLIRILVVDDSALYRQSIQNVLRNVEHAVCCGTAKDGVHALEKIEELDPDLLTLDVQMPDMDGIELLQEIRRRRLRPKAIMVSGLTSQGAKVTTDALMKGAFDFILKPTGSDLQANRQCLQESLQEKINAFRESMFTKHRSRGVALRDERDPNESIESDPVDSVPAPKNACKAVIIGTSTGGPAALKKVLTRLPEQFPIPMLVVQHMPATYTRSLAERLNSICPLSVVEATDGLEAVAGQVIIAAGGRQLKLIREGGRLVVEVVDAAPENGVRPSVDYLLRSATETVGGDALAVIMTGMGRDGLEGCRALKQAGGFVFAQCESDCSVYGMPKAVINDHLADRTLTLPKIAPAIVRHVKRSRR